MRGLWRATRFGARDGNELTRSEALIAAAFQGLARGLVEAEGPAKKERVEKPSVIPVDAVKRAVQEALPGIIAQMADDVPPEPDLPFGLGEIEDERARRQGGSGDRYDPNMPGAGGWQAPPE